MIKAVTTDNGLTLSVSGYSNYDIASNSAELELDLLGVFRALGQSDGVGLVIVASAPVLEALGMNPTLVTDRAYWVMKYRGALCYLEYADKTDLNWWTVSRKDYFDGLKSFGADQTTGRTSRPLPGTTFGQTVGDPTNLPLVHECLGRLEREVENLFDTWAMLQRRIASVSEKYPMPGPTDEGAPSPPTPDGAQERSDLAERIHQVSSSVYRLNDRLVNQIAHLEI